MIFGVFGEKSLNTMKDDYFEKNFWKKSHSKIHTSNIYGLLFHVEISAFQGNAMQIS